MFSSIWNNHQKCLSYIFLLHFNSDVMDRRPLQIFHSFCAGSDYRRQNLTYLDVRLWRVRSGPALKGLMPMKHNTLAYSFWQILTLVIMFPVKKQLSLQVRSKLYKIIVKLSSQYIDIYMPQLTIRIQLTFSCGGAMQPMNPPLHAYQYFSYLF